MCNETWKVEDQKCFFFFSPSKKYTESEKLGCQKPCWDLARLSSLVNKQVVHCSAGQTGVRSGQGWP